MRTEKGRLNVRLVVVGGWGMSVTELRTYRNTVRYARTTLPYERNAFVRQSEVLAVDKALLYDAFTPCLQWKEPDSSVMTFDSEEWSLTLRLNSKQVFFSHDTYTDDYLAFIARLEQLVHRRFG